jgi:hypothetical protein
MDLSRIDMLRKGELTEHDSKKLVLYLIGDGNRFSEKIMLQKKARAAP